MIRKRRLDIGLRQIDAAKIIGCDEMTIVNWEKGHSKPRVNYMSGVVQFLGFNPFPDGANVAQKLANHRMALGLTQTAFAANLDVDPSTLRRWERGEREPTGQLAEKLAKVLSRTPSTFGNA